MERTIGERLKIARKRAKIRQEDAAKQMDMARPTLSAIEADKRIVWAHEIIAFAELYHVSANELLYGFKDEQSAIEITEKNEDQSSRLAAYALLFAQLNEKNQKKILKTMKDLRDKQ